MSAPRERLVGCYILGKTLGKGGFAKVKLATHKDTGQKVAMKIMEKNPKTQGQLEREIAALQRVKHQNVIRILSYLGDDCKYPKKKGPIVERVVFVLELAEGGMLFEFLQITGPFNETLARTYFRALILGVEACHAQGIAHRDLKPENLLMDSNFVLKIADFGMALLQHRLAATQVGTPAYQAPETFHHNNNHQGYDAYKSDLWACGVILFIMLSGHPPFALPNAQDWWFDKLSRGAIDLFWAAHSRSSHFSPKAQDLLTKLLQVNPQQRITLVDIKNHAWLNEPALTEVELVREMTARKAQITVHQQRARLEEVKAIHQHVERPPKRDLDMPDEPLPVPQPYVVDESVACYTTFRTKCAAFTTLSHICDAVEQLGGKYKVVIPEYRVKAYFDHETKGTIIMQMQIYELKSDDAAASQPVHVVEARRFGGDVRQFGIYYEDIEKELAHLILEDPAAAAVAAIAKPAPVFDLSPVPETAVGDDSLPDFHPV